MQSNDLMDFMNSANRAMAEEYDRIQKRATEDPGTAGDQGEENWATLLRSWLPPTFQIVTKGRILSHDGIAGPQVDVLVLQPEYPRGLLDKKLYLSSGVLAAFECKLTLKAQDIEKFIQNSIAIKSLVETRLGTPYKELQNPILYGLLAHSHVWQEKESSPIENIEKKLVESDRSFIVHPIQMPDMICVANLTCWLTCKMVFLGPKQFSNWTEDMKNWYGDNGSASSGYVRRDIGQSENFAPVGIMITSLLNKLAWEYPNLQPLARYFILATIQWHSGSSLVRRWESAIYSDGIRPKIEAGQLTSGMSWNEWSLYFD